MERLSVLLVEHHQQLAETTAAYPEAAACR